MYMTKGWVASDCESVHAGNEDPVNRYEQSHLQMILVPSRKTDSGPMGMIPPFEFFCVPTYPFLI